MLIVISDLHLGSPYFKKGRDFLSFLDFVLKEFYVKQKKEIILVVDGDFFDLWMDEFLVIFMRYKDIMDKLQEMMEAGIKITWCVGNHDYPVLQYYKKINDFKGLEIVYPDKTVDIGGYRVYITHGHREYGFIPKALLELSESKYFTYVFRYFATNKFVLKLWNKVLKVFTAKNGKALSNDPFYKASKGYYKKKKGDVFIYGHTHTPQIQLIPSCDNKYMIPVLNSGTWVESSSVLILDGSSITLNEWKEGNLKTVSGFNMVVKG